jgi:hypothetical protein
MDGLKLVIFSLVVGVFKVLPVQAKNAELQTNFSFIFEQVLARKNQILNPSLAIPKVFYASQTPLKQFQDALEPQWGFRPDVFTNAYAAQLNEIYILDDYEYYKKNERCMDDSMAHELTHYVQSKYQGFDLDDESLEWDAVDVQSWFRTTYCHF